MAKDSAKTSRAAETRGGEDGAFEFQAEVARLLHLMVHSVYSERDIFLRELISNAADALDKLRYAAITKPELMADDPELRITLRADEEAGTLSVADNGIGMGRAELISNLGTIARSGTRAFLEKAEKQGDKPTLIGQFGVGFYSAFMVADRVDFISRVAGSKQAHLWSSDGLGGFQVAKAPKEHADAVPRGTLVMLHLKDDAREFLKEAELTRIVRAYSDHVPFQIDFLTEKDGKVERRQLNSGSPLWTRPRAEITQEHYNEFYHHTAGQFDEPALTIHYKAEGRHEYTVLLFVPSMRPFDLYDPARTGRVRLYVRRVFITDEADILPPWLRFVRGVIDSEDMPLNISREMLQNNPIVAAIRRAVTNRVLAEIGKCAKKEPEKFITIWEPFGAVIKEGLYEDPERRDELFKAVRFKTTRGEDWRSLAAYVADMRENQTAICYLTGESEAQLRASPQLEGFAARGVEVLLLSDPVDNFWVTTALGYEGKPFQSITQGEADLSNIPLLDEKKKQEEAKPDAATAEAVGRLKAVLADAVSDVRVSARLVDSPACLVAGAGGPDRGLDKLLEKQAGAQGVLPILEINAAHPLVKALQGGSGAKAAKKKAGRKHGTDFDDLAWLLLDEARILDGLTPADPAKFAERVNRLVLADKG
jgi:molecular chaperone HtpG